MVLPDVNVLVYAHREETTYHRRIGMRVDLDGSGFQLTQEAALAPSDCVALSSAAYHPFRFAPSPP